MKFTVLASGSKGNATYIESGNTKILIDCGISFKQLKNRLQTQELDLSGLNGILITHEHHDHINGLNITTKNIDTTCYLTEDTYNNMYFKTKDNLSVDKLSFINPFESFILGDFEIEPFSVSHDASDAVGFIIKAEGKKIVFVTDIGYLPAKDFDFLENADAYIFEANYDVTLLFTSNRPFYLKQRIDSVKGHMSNNDSAYNMTKLVGDKTKNIVLIHPSRECNTKQKVLETYNEIFEDYGIDISKYNIVVATQDIPTKIIEV
jgi:phosphoribosyl 1,2-cyclic phosphodiesterase